MSSDMNILTYLEAATRAEGVRHKAIANNVANLNTPGYRRYDVRFEEVLAKLIESGKKPDEASLDAEFFQPKNTPVDANGNDVQLDAEVGEMVKNSLRHQAFVLLLKKKYDLLRTAIQTA